jgi:hypothetical protein
MVRTLTLVAALLLAGCASPQVASLRDYAATNKPLAERGSIKWSQYYSGLYGRAAAAGIPGESLARINDAIRNSQQYEAGTITREEFGYRQRAILADETSADQRRAAAQRAAAAAQFAAGLQMMQASQPHPIAQPAPTMTPSMGLMGFLQSQSVNGTLRYCRYSNGIINTVNSIDLCPLNTGQ